MKYFLFMYDTYYPAGGINDCEGSFETVTDALLSLTSDGEGNHISYGHADIATVGSRGLYLCGSRNSNNTWSWFDEDGNRAERPE